SIPQQAGARLVALPLQTQEQQRALLETANDTARPYPARSALVAEFLKVAAAWPDAVAVHSGVRQLRYRTLHLLSDGVAQFLLQHPAWTPGCRIALMLEKDQRALVVILAILKSRAVYLPLAANTPRERVEQVLEAGDAPLLFAESAQLASLQSLPVAL